MMRAWAKDEADSCQELTADGWLCVLNKGHDGECFDGQCNFRHPTTGERCVVPVLLATDEHWAGPGSDHEFGPPPFRERVRRG